MLILGIVSFLASIISGSYGSISAFVTRYGYLAVFVLMALESSSLPVPSEVVLPLAGAFVAEGILGFPIVLLVAMLGGITGTIIDYEIGYFVGKDIIYKHLRLFHIKKESLDRFDRWFEKNGLAAIFFTRLVPVVRTFINFPAGFAKLDFKEFMAYSIAGMLVWDIVLLVFGFYLFSTKNAVIILSAIGIFAILLYAVYKYAMMRMKR
ncbi:MAG: DedA family protein [Candidatus Micrarchaeaceae archaeon]